MTVESLLERPQSLYIGGGWRAPARGKPITVVDPSSGAPFSAIAGAGPAEVEAAVTAASIAFPAWRALSGAARARYLEGFATGLAARRPALVAVQMRNNGKPRAEAETDLADAIATLRYYADLVRALDARQGAAVALPDPAYDGRTRLEPLGPVGLIVPWNFPLVTSAWKLAPALAAGCTVVLKTSEYTPLVELAYGDIAGDIGLPAGVLNVVTGVGTAGAALTGDPRLAKLSFTGSNAVGAKVMAAAAARCVPVSLELGGKSPILVFADSDPDQAVDCILSGIFTNCGQMCSATARLILERSAAPAILERLVARTRALRVGPPSEPDSEMGPLTTEPQYRKVLECFARAEAEGLHCLTGGRALERGRGFFVEPTIYDAVPRESALWREEIFGPVLAVRSFGDEEEAVELANDTAYGLVATIVTGDAARAERLAARIEAGHIWINAPQVIFPQGAWGGFKASGIGRELGPWGLAAYQGIKHVTRRHGLVAQERRA